MWYTSPMSDYEEALTSAERAVKHAVSVREHHRRRTEKKSPQRQTDIQVAIDGLKDAMAPLREHLGRFPYLPPTEALTQMRERMLDASDAIQTERRKLWKMR